MGKISQKFTRAALLREKLPEAKHSADFSGKSDPSPKLGKAYPSINLRKGRATKELGVMAGVSPSTYLR